MRKVPISASELTAAEDFVRSVTDRWREEGWQDTPEHVVKATALKVAQAMHGSIVAARSMAASNP